MLRKPKLLELYTEFPAFEQSLKHRRGSLHTEFAQALQRSVDSFETKGASRGKPFASLSAKSRQSNASRRFGDVKLQGEGWKLRKRSCSSSTSVVPEDTVSKDTVSKDTVSKDIASTMSVPSTEQQVEQRQAALRAPQDGKLQKIKVGKELDTYGEHTSGRRAERTAAALGAIVRERGGGTVTDTSRFQGLQASEGGHLRKGRRKGRPRWRRR